MIFISLTLLTLVFTSSLNFVIGLSEVPVKSSCHKIISGSSSGAVKSHTGYPDSPYSLGRLCRLIITSPNGQYPEVTIGKDDAGLRPWDFAVIINGNVAKQLNFICDAVKYTKLGKQVLKKHFEAFQVRSLRSNTSTIVIDFCTSEYAMDLDSRKGFTVEYVSSNQNEAVIQDPAVPEHPVAPQRPIDPHGPVISHDHAPHESSVISHGPKISVVVPSSKDSEAVSTPRPSPWFSQVKRCGKPQNPPSRNLVRIVNGVFARPNSWPWICALINEQWVLTAAHCVDSLGADYVKVDVYLGVENLKLASDADKYHIQKVIMHENYNNPPGVANNDIALLKLDRVVQFSDDASPACLPTKSVHVPVPSVYAANGRRICYVAGWGLLYDGQPNSQGGDIGAGSDLLKQIPVEIMSQTDCKNLYQSTFVITDEMFCGGYDKGKYDSCQGDSGGPLVCDDGTGRWTLYGIVSHGMRCAQERSPGIYTNVALLLDWIISKMQ